MRQSVNSRTLRHVLQSSSSLQICFISVLYCTHGPLRQIRNTCVQQLVRAGVWICLVPQNLSVNLCSQGETNGHVPISDRGSFHSGSVIPKCNLNTMDNKITMLVRNGRSVLFKSPTIPNQQSLVSKLHVPLVL